MAGLASEGGGVGEGERGTDGDAAAVVEVGVGEATVAKRCGGAGLAGRQTHQTLVAVDHRHPARTLAQTLTVVQVGAVGAGQTG